MQRFADKITVNSLQDQQPKTSFVSVNASLFK